MPESDMGRRQFLGISLAASAAATFSPVLAAERGQAKRIRVGIIGCGSVSGSYLPHLTKCPYAEVVSLCDIRPERAESRGKQFDIRNRYPHVDKMLAGVPFDMLVNLTDMQEHEHLNRQALEAGKHVWSEKPLANSLTAGQDLLKLARQKDLKFWGAPAMMASPQFAFMTRTLQSGKLGRIAAAHADYGHTGPDWSAFFYEKGGGSLPDLAVYNLTTMTGLLGPAKAVVAMTSIVTPTRKIQNRGEIRVEVEDNAMVLMDHGDAVISHVQSGFNYFNPSGHDGKDQRQHTITVIGTKGSMGLVGYDWEPHGVDVATEAEPGYNRFAVEKEGFVWQMGASLAAESLATGKEILITPEHALHVLEIIQATRLSQTSGRRIALRSTFKWPVVS
jgi:predicted dehydrogenase